MQKFLDQLNDKLIYINDTVENNTITINCTVEKMEYNIRGYKIRILKDINFGDKFVIINIKLPIYYTDKTRKKSFVHPLNCCDNLSRRTKRLDSHIIENLKESSAIGLERTLKKTTCNISDTSITRMLKKKRIHLATSKNMKK